MKKNLNIDYFSRLQAMLKRHGEKTRYNSDMLKPEA